MHQVPWYVCLASWLPVCAGNPKHQDSIRSAAATAQPEASVNQQLAPSPGVQVQHHGYRDLMHEAPHLLYLGGRQHLRLGCRRRWLHGWLRRRHGRLLLQLGRQQRLRQWLRCLLLLLSRGQ